MTPFKEGFLAGVAEESEFSNPYPVSVNIANRDYHDWNAGYKIGLKLRLLVSGERVRRG